MPATKDTASTVPAVPLHGSAVDSPSSLRFAAETAAFNLHPEIVERSIAHVVDHGGVHQTRLRDRKNIHKRNLLHIAVYNLGLRMRLLCGAGTPSVASVMGVVSPGSL